MSEQKKFPKKRFFKCTPENIAAFRKEFPNARTIGSSPDEYFKCRRQDHVALSTSEDFLDWNSDNGWAEQNGYTEYVFEKPEEKKSFPVNHYFVYTPENMEAFEREFPGEEWNANSGMTVSEVIGSQKKDGSSVVVRHEAGYFNIFSKDTHHTGSMTEYKFEPKVRTLTEDEYIVIPAGKLGDAKKLFPQVAKHFSNNAIQPAGAIYFYGQCYSSTNSKTGWDIISGGASEKMKEALSRRKEVDWLPKEEAVAQGQIPPNHYIRIPKGRLEEARKKFGALDKYCSDYGTAIARENQSKTVCFAGYLRWSREVPEGSWPEKEEHHWFPKEEVIASTKPPQASGDSVNQSTKDSMEWLRNNYAWSDQYTTLKYSPTVSINHSDLVKEDDMNKNEMQEIANMVVEQLKPKKPESVGITGKAASWSWSAFKSTAKYCFAPAAPWVQNIVFLIVASGIGYGTFKSYNWAKNTIQLPKIVWEEPASPSDHPFK